MPVIAKRVGVKERSESISPISSWIAGRVRRPPAEGFDGLRDRPRARPDRPEGIPASTTGTSAPMTSAERASRRRGVAERASSQRTAARMPRSRADLDEAPARDHLRIIRRASASKRLP
jgi:hypothetical protein